MNSEIATKQNALEQSDHFKEDLKTKRLFSTAIQTLQLLEKQIGDMITVGTAMRTSIGTTLLSLSTIEAMHVEKTHACRVSDSALTETEAKLNEQIETAKNTMLALSGVIERRNKQVIDLATQADRIQNDHYVLDSERGPPLPGFVYLDMDGVADLMGGVSHPLIRKLIGTGELPTHDAIQADGKGQPKLLWLKASISSAATHYKARKLKPVA